MTKRGQPSTTANTKRRREPLLAPDGAGLQTHFYTGLLFGPNGCGKTTFAEQIAHYYARLGGKVWAVDPNGAWVKAEGVKSLWPEDGAEGVDAMLLDSKRWGPGLVIFDDADSYIRHATQTQLTYLTSNRHYRKDQIVIARRPQGIPKDAIASARFIGIWPGALTEVHAHKYLGGIFPDEILSAVPTREYHFLLIIRHGARWTYEKRQTKPRAHRLGSDKT